MGILIFIIPIVLFAAGIAIMHSSNYSQGKEIICILLISIGVSLSIFSYIVTPICYFMTVADIKAFKEAEQTYIVSRENMTEIERAALVRDVAKMNRYLARQKYWNGTILDYAIPDEIDELKPISMSLEK